MIKKKKEPWEKRKREHSKNAMYFPSFLDFPKLCMMMEANILTLPNVILNEYRGLEASSPR